MMVNIPQPCQENWNEMDPSAEGRFCNSCEKVVMDFTGMSDAELVSFLQNRKGNECGRFRAGQVVKRSFISRFKFRAAAFFTLLAARFLSTEAKAQDNLAFYHDDTTEKTYSENNIHSDSVVYHVSGTVVSKHNGTPLSYVTVLVEVNGEPVGASAYTDADGKFELNIPAKQQDDRISLTFSKFRFREVKIKSYQPVNKPLEVKMSGHRKKHHRGRYVMGKF